MISLDEIFAIDGPLAKVRGTLEPRPGQLQMARLIERGILEQLHTIVEAGTGVGKSYGYIIPALRSGKRVVISTGTVALQERLIEKDIPEVAKALGIEPKVALLKGRNHYLCREKFLRQSDGSLLAPTQSLDALWNWALDTPTGDRAELSFVPPGHEWESMDADADDCIGELCGEFSRCHYFRARAQAREAQIVVVNHALFFLDLARGGLIPPYDCVILDEAHQCEHWATSALTGIISERTVGRVLRRMSSSYHVPSEHVSLAEVPLRALADIIGGTPHERETLRWESTDSRTKKVAESLTELRNALRRSEEWLEIHGAAAQKRNRQNEDETLRRLELHIREIRALIATIDLSLKPHNEAVAWLDRGDVRGGVHTAPYDVAPFLRNRLFDRVESVVLTSATIAESRSFTYIRRTLGIQAAQELIVPSPFSYERQARLFLAPAALNPKSATFAERAVPVIEETLAATRGRAFVLFTSHARMQRVWQLLSPRLRFPARVQGEMHQSALLRWFHETKHAVLFATGSFWEGVDVAGDALSCVIIDRLPFPSPGDPLVAARMAALEEAGLDAFDAYMVPSAIARLKQGFGRLIRSSSDYGALVLLDGRAGSTGFGEKIISSLPRAARIARISDLAPFFAREEEGRRPTPL